MLLCSAIGSNGLLLSRSLKKNTPRQEKQCLFVFFWSSLRGASNKKKQHDRRATQGPKNLKANDLDLPSRSLEVTNNPP